MLRTPAYPVTVGAGIKCLLPTPIASNPHGYQLRSLRSYWLLACPQQGDTTTKLGTTSHAMRRVPQQV